MFNSDSKAEQITFCAKGDVMKLHTTTVWPISAGGCQFNVPVPACYKDMALSDRCQRQFLVAFLRGLNLSNFVKM